MIYPLTDIATVSPICIYIYTLLDVPIKMGMFQSYAKFTRGYCSKPWVSGYVLFLFNQSLGLTAVGLQSWTHKKKKLLVNNMLVKNNIMLVASMPIMYIYIYMRSWGIIPNMVGYTVYLYILKRQPGYV